MFADASRAMISSTLHPVNTATLSCDEAPATISTRRR
jgi:hypothetical protein